MLTFYFENAIDIKNDTQSCDEVLGRMEELLSVFQSDLGNISGEIQSLQEQSTVMSVKLKNRKVKQRELDVIITHVLIQIRGRLLKADWVKRYMEWLFLLML